MIKLIIFDLDGVLINSIKNMEYAWKMTCKHEGLKIPFKNYKNFIGLPFFKILNRLRIPSIKHEAISQSYKYYSLKKKKFLKIKKKDIDFLYNLKKNKFKLALFTSKDSKRSNIILGKNKHLFDYMVFPEKNLKGKPFPDGINKILNKLKINKKFAIYIGDTSYDLKSAKAAKIKYLHAEWGIEKIKEKSILRVKKIQDIYPYLK